MAKRAAGSKATSKKSAVKKRPRKKPARPARATASRGGDHIHEDDSVCGCDFEFSEADATSDVMLPEAMGGVETAAAARRR